MQASTEAPDLLGDADEPKAVGGARRRGGPVAVVVASLLGLAAAVGWWATHAAAFPQFGNTYGLPVRLGEMGQFGLVFGPLPDVEVTRAAVVVGADSVPAALRLSLCEPRVPEDAPEGSVAGPVGTVRGPLSPHCKSITTLDGADLGTLPADTYVVLTVVPQAPGRVTIEGFDVEFRDGLRRGRERTGLRVHVDATSASAGE